MANYMCYIPFQHDMGSISPFVVSSSPIETKEQNALWEINRMRDHDDLPHFIKLPRGTKFVRVKR